MPFLCEWTFLKIYVFHSSIIICTYACYFRELHFQTHDKNIWFYESKYILMQLKFDSKGLQHSDTVEIKPHTIRNSHCLKACTFLVK